MDDEEESDERTSCSLSESVELTPSLPKPRDTARLLEPNAAAPSLYSVKGRIAGFAAFHAIKSGGAPSFNVPEDIKSTGPEAEA